MKESYNFKKTLLLVAMLLLFSAQLWAQVVITPHSQPLDPAVMRLQPSTFTVEIINNTSSVIPSVTVEAIGSAGFTVTNPCYIGPLQMGSNLLNLTVMPDCTAPQFGGTITYNVYSGTSASGTPLNPEPKVSPEITITESDFQFTPPPNYLTAPGISTTTEYTRMFKIISTALKSSVSDLRVTNTCDTNSIKITKVEVMKEIAGEWVPIYILPPPYFAKKATGMGYTYHFNFLVWLIPGFGNGNATFDEGEELYVRETYLITKCGQTPSNYTIEYGGNMMWCNDKNNGIAVTNVTQPVFNYSSVLMGYDTPTPDPSGCTITGRRRYRLTNTSTDAGAIMRNISLGGWLASGDANACLTKAYLTDASGVQIGPDQFSGVWCNTNSNDKLSFTFLDGTGYPACGLIAADSDGTLNDLPPGGTIYYTLEFTHSMCSAECASKLLCSGYFLDNYYTDLCNTRQIAATGILYTTDLSYGAPQSLTVDPPNIPCGYICPVTVTFFQTGTTEGTFSNATTYEQYVVFTLPEGFDYDPSKQGIKINGVLVALADVVRTVNTEGLVELRVRDRANGSTSKSYSVDMFPTGAITNKMDKNITVWHEWVIPGQPTIYKYACYTRALNFSVHKCGGCFAHLGFDIKRMTFGWTDYLKGTRIDLTNIQNYPGIDRSVAGPWDNVDWSSAFQILCADGWNDGFRWIVSAEYDRPSSGQMFFFPDPDKAVEVRIETGYGAPLETDWKELNIDSECYSGGSGGSGGSVISIDPSTITQTHSFWLPASAVTINTSGSHYTMWVDITDYTTTTPLPPYAGQYDVVYVTFKTQTNETMPDTKTVVYRTSMSSHSTQDPDDYTLWLKNFSVVDYAVKQLDIADCLMTGTGSYRENDPFRGQAIAATRGRVMSDHLVFPNEYRPNQYATRWECTFNKIWNIQNVGAIVRQLDTVNPSGPPISLVYEPLPSSDYAITHAGGNSTVVITKLLQSNYYSMGATPTNCFVWRVFGSPDCPTGTLVNTKVDYLYYPSSERLDRIGTISLLNKNPYEGCANQFYKATLTTTTPTTVMQSYGTSWNFTLTNTSDFRTTDDTLSNCWISFTVPDHVPATSLLLTSGSSTWDWSHFIHYENAGGKDKYWVKLGDLSLPNPWTKAFNFSCSFGDCAPFTVELVQSQSKIGYPIDPISGFAGDAQPCPARGTLTLYATAPICQLRGAIEKVNPLDNLAFCTPLSFKATFSNSYENDLTNLKLEMRLCAGLEIDIVPFPGLSGGGTPVDAVIYDPDLTGATERTVILTIDPAFVLTGFSTPDRLLYVEFTLKPTCNFSNGYIVYGDFMANSVCGDITGETKQSPPLIIPGFGVTSYYSVTNVLVTPTTIDLSTPSAVSTITSSGIILDAEITTSSPQAIGDYVAVSVPLNMSVTTLVGPTFVSWKIESGAQVWKADIPNPLAPNPLTIQLKLTPTNTELWSCANAVVEIYSGTYLPQTCGVPCGVDEKHGSEVKRTLNVIKKSVAFKDESITATGGFNSTTTESITFGGTLTLPNSTYLDDVVIEVFSDHSGTLIPVVPAAGVTISPVSTGPTQTEVPFTFSDVIPAADICNLYLVIRHENNPYICEGDTIPVPIPNYPFSPIAYTTCPELNLPISAGGEISAYTYTWTPTTYIVGSNEGTDIVVNYPATIVGKQGLSLTINRLGCNVAGNVTVTVLPKPAITTPPSITDQVMCKSATGVFPKLYVITNSSGYDYEWYMNTTGTNTGGTLVGTDSTYIPPANLPVNDYYFYCIVSNTCGPVSSAISGKHSVVVTNITADLVGTPADTLCTGSTVDFPPLTVTATGKNLHYQWFRNSTASNTGGNIIPGSISNTYTPPGSLSVGTYYYYCEIYSDCGDTVTKVSKAHVILDPTTISVHPLDTPPDSMCFSTTNNFPQLSVTAIGTNLHYQWYEVSTPTNTGGSIVGTDSPDYTPSGNKATGSYYYYCVVSGGCGDVTTNVSREHYIKAPTVITVHPLNTPADSMCFSTTDNFPQLSVTATGAAPLHYQWYEVGTPTNTGGSTVGTDSPDYTPSGNKATGSYYYYCVVSCACGDATTNVSREHYVKALTKITGEPSASDPTAKCKNTGNFPSALTVTATGEGTLEYHWYMTTTAVYGTADTPVGTDDPSYTPISNLDPNDYYYYCIVIGECDEDTTDFSGKHTILDPTLVTGPGSTPVDPKCYDSGNFLTLTVTATGTPTISYEWFRTTTPAYSLTDEPVGTNSNSFTPPSNVTENYYYYCVVNAFCGKDTSDFSTQHIVKASTKITVQPLATPVGVKCFNTGNFLQLSVIATGSGTVSYQWYWNHTASTTGGTEITGATSATYTPTSDITPGDYYYFCVVSSECYKDTSALSGNHPVTPRYAPSIGIDAAPVCAGNVVVCTSTATHQGTAPAYQWSVNGTDVTGATGITYSYIPANGDKVICTLTSSDPCTDPATVTSNELTMSATATPAGPVVTLNPLPAHPWMPIDLNTAVLYEPGLTYTYYENADGTGKIKGTVVTYIPPKDTYYVSASDGPCEGLLSPIILKNPCPTEIEDLEGNPYKVTSLGGLCWTENLKSTLYSCSGESIEFAKVYTCPTCPPQLDTTYGLLYDWYSATGGNCTTPNQGICPNGYHIPSQEEWSRLAPYVLSSLKSTSYWLDPPGAGTDDYGWDARPAGWYNGALNRFQDLYGYTAWWSSEDPGTSAASSFFISYYCDKVQKEIVDKGNGLSVRCVMNY